MKLSKTSLLVIIAGVLIIALAGVGFFYYQQINEQNQLNEQLALAQSRLSGVQLEKLSSQQAELDTQLSQTTAQFEEVRALFSHPFGSIAVTDTLFDIAEAHGLEITVMTSPGLASESLEETTCLVTTLNATVEGDVPNLVDFVISLNSQLATGVVKSITITIPETTGEMKEGEMKVKIYTIPTCDYCHQAKEFLSERGVKFTEYDVSSNRPAADEMVDLTGQTGVPVIVVDGQVVIGFDRARLEQLLGNVEKPSANIELVVYAYHGE